MSLIDVAMEEGEIMLARIVDTLEDGYNVQFLNPTRNEDYFRFDIKTTYKINKEKRNIPKKIENDSLK